MEICLYTLNIFQCSQNILLHHKTNEKTFFFYLLKSKKAQCKIKKYTCNTTDRNVGLRRLFSVIIVHEIFFLQ